MAHDALCTPWHHCPGSATPLSQLRTRVGIWNNGGDRPETRTVVSSETRLRQEVQCINLQLPPSRGSREMQHIALKGALILIILWPAQHPKFLAGDGLVRQFEQHLSEPFHAATPCEHLAQCRLLFEDLTAQTSAIVNRESRVLCSAKRVLNFISNSKKQTVFKADCL